MAFRIGFSQVYIIFSEKSSGEYISIMYSFISQQYIMVFILFRTQIVFQLLSFWCKSSRKVSLSKPYGQHILNRNWPFIKEIYPHNQPKWLWCAFNIIMHSQALNCMNVWPTSTGPKQLCFEFLILHWIAPGFCCWQYLYR